MVKIAKAIGVGVLTLAAIIFCSGLGSAIAAVSFALMGWWAIAALAVVVVTAVAVISYRGGHAC